MSAFGLLPLIGPPEATEQLITVSSAFPSSRDGSPLKVIRQNGESPVPATARLPGLRFSPNSAVKPATCWLDSSTSTYLLVANSARHVAPASEQRRMVDVVF